MQRCYPAFIHGCMFNSPISLSPETHIFFRPCTFRHVRSVFMAILTFLTIIDYSWQQGIGFEHFIDSFYDRHRIFPTVQKCREEKDIVLQNDGKIFAFSFALFKMFIDANDALLRRKRGLHKYNCVIKWRCKNVNNFIISNKNYSLNII